MPMLAISIILLTIYVILYSQKLETVFSNILNIIAWVFTWETIELFCFKRSNLRLKQLRNIKIIEAQISF